MSRIITQAFNNLADGINRLERYATEGGGTFDPMQSRLWPITSQLIGGDPAQPLMPEQDEVYDFAIKMPGGSGAKRISITTRDQVTGAAIASCTVYVFTSAGLLESSLTSDANGNCEINVQTTGNYFIVAFKPGSPDAAGVTDNNIAGV